MTSSVFPDLNVWIALSHERHVHHSAAAEWFGSLPPEVTIWFCRFTQLGFFRLLGNAAVMDQPLTQLQAWRIYDQWLKDDRVRFHPEPSDLDSTFRALTQRRQAAVHDWADSYLAAFATTISASLVTFDQALGRRVPGAIALPAA